jgi:hypothetical protein
MSSTEAASARRADLLSLAEDQLRYGIYKQRRKDEKVVDLKRSMRFAVLNPKLHAAEPVALLLGATSKDAFIAEKVREGDKPSEAGFKSFAMFDLNEAIMHVKQGTGRLMRDEADLGIAAILDPRMNPRPHPSAKAYGPQIRSNCSQPVTYDRTFVLQFLGQLGSRLVP